MRRKSSRNASKTSEKARESSPMKKSRRHSKRRRRSSSRSSSEDSDDGDAKAAPAQQAKQEPSEIAAPVAVDMPEEQPVWTVTQSTAPSGEIQKLKICLTKPSLSPDKSEQSARRRRNKSGSQTESEVASPDDKSARKLRRRGSPGANVDEQEDRDEELEDRGKGKSKNKHKSKSEKAPEIQSEQMQTKHDLSENVQVTPQSPQATIDIRVDNESMSTIDVSEAGTDSVPESANVPEISDLAKSVEKSSDKAAETSSDKAAEMSSESIVQPAETTKQLAESCDSEGNFRGFDSSEQKEIPNVFDEGSSEVVPEKFESEAAEASQPAETDAIQNEEPKIEVQLPTETTLKQEAEAVPTDSKTTENLETEDVQVISAETTENLKTEAAHEKVETVQTVEVKEVAQNAETEEIVESTSEKDIASDSQPAEQKTEEESTKENIEKEPEALENKDVDSGEVTEKVETVQSELSDQSSLYPESTLENNTLEETVTQKEETSEHPENKDSLVSNEDPSTKSATVVEELQQCDEDSKSMDLTITTSTLQEEKASFTLTKSCGTSVEEAEKVESPEIASKQHHKRKWGNSLVSLQLMGPVLHTIDFETIKQFCPDLKLLEENELKMDIRDTKDRRRSSEQKERRPERKVSVDHKSSSNMELRKFEPQNSLNLSVPEEPAEPEMDNSNIIAMNRKISIVDDTASKLKPPPSPAKNPVSEVLYITNLVRPFTLKQLKELLERTGKIRENGFWTDRIKSKCYVYYDATEEAEATRNALHGVNWPIGNGKKLIIDYATPEDLEKARNPAPPPPPPMMPEQQISEKENQVPEKKLKLEEPEKVVKDHERRKNEMHVREWDIGKADLHRMRSRSRERDGHGERNDRRKHRRTPTPVDDFIARKQRKKEEDIPQKLMDDLFRKTKTTPSIYWLPLTPEEIATKQQQRLLRMAEHKRRMEESSRNRSDYGRGAPYRRRYD